MEEKKCGKVWIAGAGPGDAGLLTVKTASLMEQADAVVYDALVSAEILSLIPEKTEKINVGKRADHHLVPQKEINQILVNLAKEGKQVLRLKGGDPFVFGRGGEEAEFLVQEDIDFEIVPGITSSVAVPAYAGIPVTHRDYTSSFHVITGHERKGGESRIDYETLARMDATLVFLMGVTALPEICEKLRMAGMPDDTPAAVIQEGTLACQKKVVSDLQNLPKRVQEEKIQAPAVIVVGKVCALSESFSWAEQRHLGGRQILITRPRSQGQTFARTLRGLGAQVIEFPSIQVEPLQGKREKERILTALKEIRNRKTGTSWIVFTSAAGVRSFFNFLEKMNLDIRTLWGSRFAVIGSGTGRELGKRGIRPDLMPDIYEAEKLGEALAGQTKPGDLVTAFRAREASEELFPPVLKTGAECVDIPVYETGTGADDAWTEKIAAQFQEGKIDLVTFTSASTVRGFERTMQGKVDPGRILALCIGRKTEEEAKRLGMRTAVAEEATVESMTEKILEIL
ncbi:uroporphyrinogen-III C-methyltransferase [Drancourtella sp. An57]|uniref:uroporphyrinogen-III C-methyltransferase n=1 Tax=Drancourtella sp. An57 TaxID=1965647 RepID=UPI000B396851|nr:uroporphyrinogen-III C-methyltransferase [Drancourtella sp. An57]OUN70082.1 uroporphyrinogen-III C-methyltransferase [Drancourtella sp. An57]